MASRIDHGAPGSFKSFALVQRFGIPALVAGRVIVTNIRGFNSIDRVKLQFPDLVFPDSAQIIFVTAETKLGRALMAGFFHWIPFGSLVLMDEAQRIYPKRASFKLESLDKYICPVGYKPEQLPVTEEFPEGIPRPEDVNNAFDMQRHFQWDIYLSTPNIAKIQPIIREVCVTAFLHKSLGEKLPFLFKNTWYEFQHDAENNGKTISNRIGTPHKYKADIRIFKCYQSTATGEHTASNADKSILSDNGVRFKLAIILLSICTGIFFMFRFASAHDDLKIDAPVVESIPKAADSRIISTNLESNQLRPDSVIRDSSLNVGHRETVNFSDLLGFELLALAVHDLKDTKKTAFIVATPNGLKSVPYAHLVAYGFEVFIHGLCHVTLKHSSGKLLNMTCYHAKIDRCTSTVQSPVYFNQHDCMTYAVKTDKADYKTNNAIVTASTNLLGSN